MEDGNIIQNEIDNLIDFNLSNSEINKINSIISVINGEHFETADDALTPDKITDSNIHIQNDTISEIVEPEIQSGESDSNTINRPIEKLRIIIPPMASPSSMYSSSSDSNSPIRSKKGKKRFCIKCNIRFKHTVEWLEHLKDNHISLPFIKLKKLTTTNPYYSEYLERRKHSRSPNDFESLKIRLKIPRTDDSIHEANSHTEDMPLLDPLVSLNTLSTSSSLSSSSSSTAITNGAAIPNDSGRTNTTSGTNECRIRVLRAEEIKQSPPRSPLTVDLPINAMVSVPTENHIRYECPTLDGIGQFAEESMNEESAAQLLKNLLEKPNEPVEASEYDSVSSEFISIDRLAHTCQTCNEKYPNLNFLHEHQRLTGHGDRTFSSPSILEPIQEMTVDPVRQYHPPTLRDKNRMLQSLLGYPKLNPPQMPVRSPPMYGQPSVLNSIHHMENQVRNFPNMNQMPSSNRQGFGMPPQNPSQMPPNYPMHQYLPPSQMMRTNQPNNMAPFYNMNPDMYNPSGKTNFNNNTNNSNNNMPMNGNVFNRPPNHMLRPPWSQSPPQQSMMNRFPVRPPQQQLPQPPSTSTRPIMNGPLQSRSIRPPYPTRPIMNMGPPQRPMPLSALEQQQKLMEQQQKSRYEQIIRSREIENRPFISNAPRTEGLPVIESVQSGAITLNSTKKPSDSGTIQISDQITLSIKNKELPSLTTIEKPAPPTNDTNKMKSILANRGITVKSASKVTEKKSTDETNKLPISTAEAAVQKLQMNNSVSIISKKKGTSPNSKVPASKSTSSVTATIPETDTIDLSIDDETPATSDDVMPTTKPRPLILKCHQKSCDMRFASVRALRDHTVRVHQKFRCTTCFIRFSSSEALRVHCQKSHGQAKPKPVIGIPLVNFSNPNTRKKMLSLGFTNFLPITNTSDEKSDLFGMPIININGPSINNLKNLFDTDSTKIMPIQSPIRSIPRPKITPSSQQTPSQSQTVQPPPLIQSPALSRPVPRLIAPAPVTSSKPTDPSPTLQK